MLWRLLPQLRVNCIVDVGAHTGEFGTFVRNLIGGIRDARVYLKLDTQGWDLEVLSGATGCLERIVAAQSEMPIRPIYEGMPTASEAIGAFSASGFDVVGMFPLNPLPGDRALNEFDCVMIRRD
jgi:hypothetical protein